MPAVANFVGDWVELMKGALEKSGTRTQSLQTDQEISLAFWNMVHRRIQTRARRVHVAREFACPDAHISAVQAIKKKLELGEDVNRHRSSAALNPKQKAFNDRLLNDWGVQHLHLGPENPEEKLSGRTDYCLYVYFTDTDAYFLDVMAHDNYEKQELMLRLHRNWPEVIAEHRADGVTDADRWEDSHVKKLRSSGFTYLLTLDGVVYITPGGGYAKNGNSFKALRLSNRAFNTLHEW